MHAMPVMLGILCVMMIAYRYYSAFIAAKVAVLNDARVTPAVRLNDGQNYHPTNKWVLFGHHFAAISGAGPLIGPVLAAQFGYLPGLLWIVIGVCLGGAVQDFLVLVASMRRNGRSLAQIAFEEIGKVGGTAAMAAILFIIVIALAGLGKVVVKALGGETVKYPEGSRLVLPAGTSTLARNEAGIYQIPAGTRMEWGKDQKMTFNDTFPLKTKAPTAFGPSGEAGRAQMVLPADAQRLVPGSPWGTFTIAATIPIALFVGLYMYKIRPGRVVEASLIGGALTIGATVAGAWVAEHQIGQWFNLTNHQVTVAMAIYGFVAAVLPVWVLLAPRDYLSSFLKIGTIALLVIGTIAANPRLEAPAVNHVFLGGGPTVSGKIFPFLFITVMCGAISGFHALVSSGTTPKMIGKETQARAVGYGGMLIEGLVAVVAMIAAASLPTGDYYAMNTELSKVPQFHDKILQVGGGGGIDHINVPPDKQDNIPEYEELTKESLRGRTGGAVTLAVGMAHIFDQAAKKISVSSEEVLRSLWKYWYHFAIMFEALFILTTIDAGTRIGRFLVQEVGGKVWPRFGVTDWWPSAIIATLLIVTGWAYFIGSNNFETIWKMFGIANQMLAVIALAIVTVCIVNEGRGRYAWVTIAPMCIVIITTATAAGYTLAGQWQTISTQLAKTQADQAVLWNAILLGSLILAMLICAATVVGSAFAKILSRRSAVGVEAGV